MANNVQFLTPPRKLGRSDVEFLVKKNGVLLGTLTVSKGSLVWFPKKTKYGYRMRWGQFDKLMKYSARGEERR